MKTILFIIAIGCNILIGCYHGNEDGKAPYSNYDTTKPMENLNSPNPDSTSNTQLKDNAIDKNR
ncbi:MAG: hypothetical protein V4580_18050 [Bacteroidota bacterium]